MQHRRRRRASTRRPGGKGRMLVQIAGELLITLGVVLALFVAWQLWWTNIDSNRAQQEAIDGLFEDFDLPAAPPASSSQDYGDPVVLDPLSKEGETFAVVYVPRFGADYAAPVTSGVGTAVLDRLGLGHYPATAMPGGVGNFAVAGHRQTHGKALDPIHTLVPGDHIYVQTADGYYDYVYRNTQIVLPDRVDVIAAVPTDPAAVPSERFLTLTSCNPRFGSEERIIAYALLDSWQPLSAGPPPAIADVVAANASGGR
ncbi:MULTISPECIES: class E sortase [Arthrobacter]|uniref:Class E sortase n=2 Tax=Arthrobacter jinronghuae TaxID=2964609 RepID=A0ABT1NPZ2_9MICC|nr:MULTISPECIES: class E sortase [Arthrobacter]MCQ1948504.1 class E sortase [Arthrobacter jinronghuae]MCQ1951830.1 class E sortase [Arthrobacter sp. zg-Y238]MCQ1956033.1 class E sortase [Arthrobacter jinronghuae]UWX80389.1 class E sortase [Arthrobacter jinronghuae]